jgi:outer membrane protein
MRLIALAFILCLVAANAQAQAPAPRTLTLNEAVRLALDNNFSVRKAENTLSLQEDVLMQSYGQFMPSLNASFGGNRRTGRQFVQERLQFDDFTTQTLNGGVNTSIPVFTGLQNINNLRAARQRKASAEDVLQRTRENIIFQAASQFLAVLLNQELVVISRQNLENARRQLDQIKAQVDVGMRPIVDQYNQEALVANSEFELVQRENAVNLSLVQLTRVLQIDPLADYVLQAPNLSEADVSVKGFDLSELIAKALSNRSDVKAQEAQIRASRYALNAAKGGVLPTVSLSGSLSSGYSDQYRERDLANPAQFIKLGFGDQFFDRNPTRAIGFNVQIPIFNRFGTRTNIQRAQVDYKNAMLDMEDRRLGVLQEIRQAYNDYVAYAKQLRTTEAALVAATRAYETEQERYRVGASTLIELTRANTEFVNASSNRVRAIYQFVFQEKLLDYYIGNIDTNVTF